MIWLGWFRWLLSLLHSLIVLLCSSSFLAGCLRLAAAFNPPNSRRREQPNNSFRSTRLAGSPLHWGPITHPPPSKARASQLRKIKKYYNFNLFERLACLFSWLVAVGQRPAYNPPTIHSTQPPAINHFINFIDFVIDLLWLVSLDLLMEEREKNGVARA